MGNRQVSDQDFKVVLTRRRRRLDGHSKSIACSRPRHLAGVPGGDPNKRYLFAWNPCRDGYSATRAPHGRLRAVHRVALAGVRPGRARRYRADEARCSRANSRRPTARGWSRGLPRSVAPGLSYWHSAESRQTLTQAAWTLFLRRCSATEKAEADRASYPYRAWNGRQRSLRQPGEFLA